MKNKKAKQLKSDVIITNKNALIGKLSDVNFKFDMLRNGIFNVASSINYVREVNVNEDLLLILSHCSDEAINSLNKIVASLNLKFGEKLEKEVVDEVKQKI